MLERNYQAIIADQRDAYMLALDVLAAETSRAALERAALKLESDPWWREGAESIADAGAREVRALAETRA